MPPSAAKGGSAELGKDGIEEGFLVEQPKIGAYFIEVERAAVGMEAAIPQPYELGVDRPRRLASEA
jgi:hypothetical protein